MSVNVLVLHGPNLNLLGRREPGLYGAERLDEIDARLTHTGAELGITVETYQSNHEGELIDRIQASDHVHGFLVNPGGLTHTSVSLRDAFLAMDKPFVEVHCSNPAAREDFRHESLLADVASGTVAGFGGDSYVLGLRGLFAAVQKDAKSSRS